MKFIFPLILLLVLGACKSNSPVKESEIYEIRNIGTLSTSEYTVGKVVKLSDEGEWYKYGDRKILMSCKAVIKAGIDLNEISEEDIRTDGRTIEVTLPEPKIVSFEMDPRLVRTEMKEVTGFRSEFSQEDKNKIMHLGEQAIRQDLQNLDILRDANTNARNFVRDFYENLGFEEVIIHDSNKSKGILNAD